MDLFIHSLIAHGFLYGNELNILQLPFEDQEELIPLWIQDQPDIQVRFIDLDEFEKRCPQMPTAEDLSSAGSRYVELMEKKGEPNLYQRLAYALLHNDDIADCDFSITGSFSWEQVNIPENKLTSILAALLSDCHKTADPVTRIFHNVPNNPKYEKPP